MSRPRATMQVPGPTGPLPIKWKTVSRLPLIHALEEQAPPIAVLTAASGTGKTTLLAEWARWLDARSIAAITIDCAGDRLGAADILRRMAHRLWSRDMPRSDLVDRFSIGSVQHLTREFLTLLDSSARVRRLTVMLDAYDRVESDEINEMILTLTSASAECRFALATREKISIEAAAVKPITAQQLHLSDDEIASLFPPDTSADALAGISAATEGIASTVHLLWAYAQLRADFRRDAADFPLPTSFKTPSDAADLVVDMLSKEAREGLIATAYLPEFSIDLLEHIGDSAEPWRWMARLERLGLATSLRDTASTYLWRCQPQLRNMLLHALNRRGRAEMARLGNLAASWFEMNGDLLGAVRCTSMSGSTERTVQLIETAGGVEIGISRGAIELNALLDHLPIGSLSCYPRISLAQAYVLIKEGKAQIAAEIVKGVRAGLLYGEPISPELEGDFAIIDLLMAAHSGGIMSVPDQARIAEVERSPSATRPLLRGAINNILCAFELSCGELDRATSRAEAALHFYSVSASPNGLAHMHVHLGRIALVKGEPQDALDRFRVARDIFLDRSMPDLSGAALASVFSASALYDLGMTEEAATASRVCQQSTEGGEYYEEVLYSAYRTQWAIARLRGESVAAARILDLGIANARQLRNDELRRLLELHWLEMDGDASEMLFRRHAVADLLGPAIDDAPLQLSWYERDQRAIARANDNVRHGEYDVALAILTAAQQQCVEGGRVRGDVVIRLKTAMAYEGLGERATALSMINGAIRLAAPRGLVGPFLDDWQTLAGLLALSQPEIGLATADGAESRFTNDILRIGNCFSPVKRSIFTMREGEILEHLVRGESNKVIARALGISPETVRFHLKSIYGKFGVRIGHKARDVVVDLAKSRNFAG
jgi:LuxR family maltose regulon positive regulatory protein